MNQTYSITMASKNRFLATALCVVFVSLAQVSSLVAPNESFAIEGQFKYQAVFFSLYGRPSPECGGAIINDHYILTSAYCTYRYVSKLDKMMVYLGTIDINNMKQKRLIAEIKLHNEFNIVRRNFDVALVRTVVKIDLSDNVQPVKLPENADIFSGTLVHSGFELGMVHVSYFN